MENPNNNNLETSTYFTTLDLVEGYSPYQIFANNITRERE